MLSRKFKRRYIQFLRDKRKEGRVSFRELKRKNRKRTAPEEEMSKILKELNIEFEIEFPVNFLNSWKVYDFRILDKEILIEVDGDYWHGFEELNEHRNYMQLKNKRNDVIKNWLARKRGFQLLRFWEHEINLYREDVKQKIREIVLS